MLNVNQVSRIGVLVTDGFRLTNRQPGVQIDMAEQRDSVAGQHFRDRRLGKAQMVADAVWSPPTGEPQGEDTPLRASTRPRRDEWGRDEWSVAQAGYAVGLVAANPLRDSRARDLQTFRNAA